MLTDKTGHSLVHVCHRILKTGNLFPDLAVDPEERATSCAQHPNDHFDAVIIGSGLAGQ